MNPFDCGYLGFYVMCVNSPSVVKLWNSFDTKYLALSVYSRSGYLMYSKDCFEIFNAVCTCHCLHCFDEWHFAVLVSDK